MWGRDEGGQSYYVISIKRLKIGDSGIMIFHAEKKLHEKLRDGDREEVQKRGATVFSGQMK